MNACETQYLDIAVANGIDPASKDPIQCRFLNKTFARSLSELVLETGNNAGVDFWWGDYVSARPGVRPLQLRQYARARAHVRVCNGAAARA